MEEINYFTWQRKQESQVGRFSAVLRDHVNYGSVQLRCHQSSRGEAPLEVSSTVAPPAGVRRTRPTPVRAALKACTTATPASARLVTKVMACFGLPCPSIQPITLLPNRLLNRTRYGGRRKPGVRRLRHRRTPRLRRPP